MSRESLCKYGFEHPKEIHFINGFECGNPEHKRIAEIDDAA